MLFEGDRDPVAFQSARSTQLEPGTTKRRIKRSVSFCTRDLLGVVFEIRGCPLSRSACCAWNENIPLGHETRLLCLELNSWGFITLSIRVLYYFSKIREESSLVSTETYS